ncbi:hypothetical protein ABDB91_18015 [Desulfoscipio sp. XC116]|uniref:hypothetical protein n=1 Tax=Desulfoscipio sp. XC116 TaxID=3144975 RepID=UPI00325ACF5F
MTQASKKKLNKFSGIASCAVFLICTLLFWGGLNFLRAEVFPHYFDASKHKIVEQDPDTKAIYAWQDARGHEYTQEDAQVKNFTWGITALLVVVMVLGTTIYNWTIKMYTRLLLEREPKPVSTGTRRYQPELQ